MTRNVFDRASFISSIDDREVSRWMLFSCSLNSPSVGVYHEWKDSMLEAYENIEEQIQMYVEDKWKQND